MKSFSHSQISHPSPPEELDRDETELLADGEALELLDKTGLADEVEPPLAEDTEELELLECDISELSEEIELVDETEEERDSLLIEALGLLLGENEWELSLLE